MHTHKKINVKGLVVTALYSAVAVGIAGSIVGTYAWYSYNNVAFLDFTGASISNSNNLDIGLVMGDTGDSATQISTFETNTKGLVDKDTTTITGKTIFWAHSSLRQDVINEYLTVKGYAHNVMKPVTSGSYVDEETSGAVSLKAAPGLTTLEEDYIAIDTAASSANYIYLPLIFRVSKVEAGTEGVVQNKAIYLSNAEVTKTSGAEKLKNAFRISMEDPHETNDEVILNPTSTDDGEDAVGGVLNLDRDGFYDYNKDMKEIIYGEVEDTPAVTWSGALSGFQDSDGNTATAVEVEAGKADTSTFDAYHRKGVKKASFTAKTAAYKGTDNYYGVTNPSAVTNTRTDGYGRLNCKIWIEGWDLDVIDLNADAAFSLGLSFEIKD